MKLLEITSVVTAAIRDVKKKIDTKFQTLKLLEKDTPRIHECNKQSELIRQKQLYEKRLDEINNLKMEILEVMIENEKIITSKRQKEADDAEQEEFRGDQKKRYSLLNDSKFSKTKLPKLVITRFDGTNFDWFRFWNQFESQIDKCDLSRVSKT